MRTEVYTWRLEPALKRALAEAARSRRTSVSQILELATREWLAARTEGPADGLEQERLHAALADVVGSVDQLEPYSREALRRRITAPG